MKKIDIAMAIARHPDFIKEFKEYDKFFTEEPRLGQLDVRADALGKKMSAKWGIHPLAIVSKNNHFLKTGQEIKYAVWKFSGVSIRDYNSDSKRLHLIVDVTKKEGDLLKAFRKTLKDFIVKEKGKRRDKTYKIGCWKVYDMHNNEHLNLSQIARKLNPKINKSSVDDENYRSTFEAVRRAYNAAKEMIKQVEADANQREKKGLI